MQASIRGIGAAVVVAAGLAAAAPAPAEAATWKRCKPVKHIAELEGSRHADAEIVRIRALRVGCPAARRIARKATLKGIEFGPRIGIYSYARVWLIERNLRGDVDRYVATKMADVERTTTVRWRFR